MFVSIQSNTCAFYLQAPGGPQGPDGDSGGDVRNVFFLLLLQKCSKLF